MSMSKSDAQRLLEVSEALGALQYGEFTLSSGAKSHYYFDGRLVTLDAEGAYLVGRAFEPMVRASGADAIAGPALAAVPMLAAISVASYIEGAPVPGLIVRSERKAYGTGKLIEGSVREGMSVAVVDDRLSALPNRWSTLTWIVLLSLCCGRELITLKAGLETLGSGRSK